MSKASKGEGMAGVADDLEDLSLQVAKAVRYQSDRIRFFKARCCCGGGGGTAASEKEYQTRHQPQPRHLSVSLSLRLIVRLL